MQVADLHFKTFLDTNSTVRHCWRSLRPLKMLPIDSPSNFTLDGMFASHFRKRSLAKIQKIEKISPVTFRIQEEKKSRIKSNFSNLVKSASPGLRSHNDILGTAQHTRTLQFSPPRPSPPPKYYTGYHTVSFTFELPCTSVMVPGKSSFGAI